MVGHILQFSASQKRSLCITTRSIYLLVYLCIYFSPGAVSTKNRILAPAREITLLPIFLTLLCLYFMKRPINNSRSPALGIFGACFPVFIFSNFVHFMILVFYISNIFISLFYCNFIPNSMICFIEFKGMNML